MITIGTAICWIGAIITGCGFLSVAHADQEESMRMAEKMLKAKDKDKDGELSKEEFTAKPTKKPDGGGKKKKKGAE